MLPRALSQLNTSVDFLHPCLFLSHFLSHPSTPLADHCRGVDLLARRRNVGRCQEPVGSRHIFHRLADSNQPQKPAAKLEQFPDHLSLVAILYQLCLFVPVILENSGTEMNFLRLAAMNLNHCEMAAGGRKGSLLMDQNIRQMHAWVRGKEINKSANDPFEHSSA